MPDIILHILSYWQYCGLYFTAVGYDNFMIFLKTVVFISGLSNKSYRFFVPVSLFMNFPFKHKSYYFISLSEAAASDFDVLLNNVMNLKKKNNNFPHGFFKISIFRAFLIDVHCESQPSYVDLYSLVCFFLISTEFEYFRPYFLFKNLWCWPFQFNIACVKICAIQIYFLRKFKFDSNEDINN